MGIGQANPTATLDVGSGNSLVVGAGKYFDTSTASVNAWSSASTNVAIKAAGAVWSSSGNGFISTSDIRIKNDIASTTGALDLISLIDPVIFKYINRAEKGDKNIYGVIAQQIENIPALTSIVSHNTGFANDVYGLRSVTSDGKILADTSLLHVGDVIRLANETKTFEPKITSVDASGFTVDRPLNIESDKILVIGRQVNNLRAVDYDQIAMIGLSAIKELNAKIFATSSASGAISLSSNVMDIQKALGTVNSSSTDAVALIALATSTSAQSTTTVAEQMIAMITNDINSNVKVLTNMISIKVTAVVAYIDTIFAKNVHVEDKICIGKEPNVTCITKEQLDKMLEKANTTGVTSVSGSTSQTASTGSPTSQTAITSSASGTDILSTTTVTVSESISTSSASTITPIPDIPTEAQKVPATDPIVPATIEVVPTPSSEATVPAVTESTN